MQCFYSLENNSNTILFPDGVMPLKMFFTVNKQFGVTYVFIISMLLGCSISIKSQYFSNIFFSDAVPESYKKSGMGINLHGRMVRFTENFALLKFFAEFFGTTMYINILVIQVNYI